MGYDYITQTPLNSDNSVKKCHKKSYKCGKNRYTCSHIYKIWN